jgi:hypothetical protein
VDFSFLMAAAYMGFMVGRQTVELHRAGDGHRHRQCASLSSEKATG